jgi:hypothetical protein
MAFADLKNDFVFRRIFATHPDILRGLLNDLLDRTGDQTIETIEYLPSEQLPLVVGAKLSILDVRCKDRAGTTFVVEMQLIHVPGFINRIVYNACKAYAGQLKEGDWYTSLTDVVAISIPADLLPGPYRQALELANKATFTQDELDAYQKVTDEIEQVRVLAEAKWAEGFAEGETAGFTKGETAGKAAAILAVLEARGFAVGDAVRERVAGCTDPATLARWLARAVTAASAEDAVTSEPPEDA